MIGCEKYIENVQNRINPVLSNYISTKDSRVGGRVAEAMSYSLMIGGKRIRPALCIGAAEAVGGKYDKVLESLACAIEMIHTYSLIHDDLPAMDDDLLRRGKLTCHKRFDEATAILAGDALLTLAFEILAKLGLSNNLLPSQILFEIIYKISVAAGFKGMVGGQMEDISSEGLLLSEDELKNVHYFKTGIIIETAVICGALAFCANSQQLKQLKAYAYSLGLAFQITDDILNVIGNSKNLGKNVGTDYARGKNTYPSMIGLKASKKIALKLTKNALSALKPFDNRADPLRSIGYYILQRNV